MIRVPTDEAMRVVWGGDAAAGNQHAIQSDQRWAYDLMIEPYLTGSATLADYGCYGVPVVAPIGGKVVQTVSNEPDAKAGSISGKVTAPSGNHVVIEAADGGWFPMRSFSARPYASRLSLFGPRLSLIVATTISST